MHTYLVVSGICSPMDCSQAPLSMRFSRQEDWSGLLLPSPGDFPDPGVQPVSSVLPALADGFLTTEPPGKPAHKYRQTPM